MQSVHSSPQKFPSGPGAGLSLVRLSLSPTSPSNEHESKRSRYISPDCSPSRPDVSADPFLGAFTLDASAMVGRSTRFGRSVKKPLGGIYVDFSSDTSGSPSSVVDSGALPDEDSEFVLYDKTDRRYQALGGTPSITSSVGLQVLLRYIGKSKAMYCGEFCPNPTDEQLADTENWSVHIRKEEGGEREWVSLAERSPKSGRRMVHMGHKIACVDVWNNGAKFAIDSAPPEKYAKYFKIFSRYSQKLQALGKQSELGLTFMNDPNVYRLEWGPKNVKDVTVKGKKYATPGSLWKQRPLTSASDRIAPGDIPPFSLNG